MKITAENMRRISKEGASLYTCILVQILNKSFRREFYLDFDFGFDEEIKLRLEKNGFKLFKVHLTGGSFSRITWD